MIKGSVDINLLKGSTFNFPKGLRNYLKKKKKVLVNPAKH